MSFGINITKSFDFNAGFEEEIKEIQRDIIRDLADDLYNKLVSSIREGRSDWPPLSEVTRWLKGDSKVYVNDGDFLRSLQIEVGSESAQIGILAPRGPEGEDMELIARVLQGGAVIPVTERMRKWFAARGFPLRKTTLAITVPARPLFSPSMDTLDKDFDSIVAPYLDNILTRI